MLEKQVENFITQNRGSDFDSNTSVNDYRLAIKSYIETADDDFEALKLKSDIAVKKLSIKTSYGESIIHLYKPNDLTFNKLVPAILYFTGTGFVYSNPKWQARNCIDLALATNSIVLNIEERNAPEFQFPEGLNECFTMVKWVLGNCISLGVDKKDVRLCGFSSGANFAAVLARWCMENSIPIKGHYLISPWLDLTCSSDSYVRFSKGYLLDMPVCDWLRNHYIDSSKFKHPDVSPLFFSGDLRNLSPCTLIVAQFEPFYDEAVRYALKLKKGGVSVRFSMIEGQIHEYAGCNRWRLVSNKSKDPIFQVSSAIKADRLVASMN